MYYGSSIFVRRLHEKDQSDVSSAPPSVCRIFMGRSPLRWLREAAMGSEHQERCQGLSQREDGKARESGDLQAGKSFQRNQAAYLCLCRKQDGSRFGNNEPGVCLQERNRKTAGETEETLWRRAYRPDRRPAYGHVSLAGPGDAHYLCICSEKA